MLLRWLEIPEFQARYLLLAGRRCTKRLLVCKVQFDLDILLLVVLETHGLLASPSRSGLRPSFPAWPIHCSAFRHSECLTSLADCHDLICPLLTSAPRSGRLSTASVAEATRSRSPGVSSAAFCAESPD